ncbi:unnamed protein product [Trifolium pratense]|uniref:Uncharacterized protein n=1 Tax=Trifolium pratense TaxID=57577 RepID=A0ACB0J7Y5_TRIPR|nr:unnamed protein product [Trifolium pratense]
MHLEFSTLKKITVAVRSPFDIENGFDEIEAPNGPILKKSKPIKAIKVDETKYLVIHSTFQIEASVIFLQRLQFVWKKPHSLWHFMIFPISTTHFNFEFSS